LERANNYILALSQIGSLLQANLNHDQVINLLESELKKRQLQTLVVLCDDENTHDSIKQNDKSIDIQHGDRSIKDCTLPFKDIPGFKEIIEQRQAGYVPDMESWSARVLSHFPTTVPAPLNHLQGISSGMKGAVLPLCIRQMLTGLLVIWGNNLVESDLLALSVFANQVGIALENAALFETVHRLAILDGLTGVYNRRHIVELAQREFVRAKRTKHPFSLIMIDVNDFKQVNDTYGHGIGDLVLQTITHRFQEVLRKEVDVIGRYGGDEFVILLPETDLEMGQEIATRLCAYIQSQSIPTSLGEVSASISLGVSSSTDQIVNLEELFNHADQAMYQAKQAKKLKLFHTLSEGDIK
jgi:diguanylate cyclase (GGDEF)-like protein